MSLIDGALHRLRALLRRADYERDLEEEMRFHLDTEAMHEERAGSPQPSAQVTARLRFGNVTYLKEEVRRMAGLAVIDALRQDLGYAIRGLRRSPLFSLTIIATLAIGIGAVTTMYGVVRQIMLEPPPHIADPERVAKVYFTTAEPDGRVSAYDRTSYPVFEHLREHAATVSGLGATTDYSVAVGLGASATMASATLVSAGYWSVVRPPFMIGGAFADASAHPLTGERVVVLGHAFWRQQFGGDHGIVGRTITVKGQPYRVTGVLRSGFRGVDLEDIDIWLPFFARGDGEEGARTPYRSPTSGNISLVVRLRPGTTPAAAASELAELRRAFLTERNIETRQNVELAPLTGALGQDMKARPEARVAAWLVIVAGILLVVACTNVATLLLLRALSRRREIGMRMALGMSRSRLAMQLFVESAVLATAGGAAALAVVVWGGAWITRVLLPGLAWEPALMVDSSVFAVVALCVVATTVACGLAPALHALPMPMTALRGDSDRLSARRSPLHSALLVAQGTLAVLLLVGAGLFLRSLQQIEAIDLGVDRDNVLLTRIDFAGQGRTRSQINAFHERALERLRTLPAVERAGLTAASLPLRSSRAGGFDIPGRDSLPEVERWGSPMVTWVTPGFFAAVGTRLVRGRDFVESDRTGPPVLVINETMERLYWRGESALGQCVYDEGPRGCSTIIGVVEDTRRFFLREEPSLQFYRRLPPDLAEDRALIVRVAGDANAAIVSVRQALQGLDPNLPYVRIEAVGTALDYQVRPFRLGAAVFVASGVLAALLVAVGLYSAISYSVGRRTRELGVRLAVGAQSRDVIGMVLTDGAVIGLVSATIGIGLSVLAAPRIADLLFEVSPRDAGVLITVAGIPLVIAVLASVVPAWRASRVDPVSVLRAE
jgi:predicted permease